MRHGRLTMIAGLGAVGALAGRALGQEIGLEPPPVPDPVMVPGSTLVLRLGFSVIVFLAAFFFWFYVLFPVMLRSWRVWPRDAFGRVAAGFFTTLGLAGLFLFWNELVIDRIGGQPVEQTFVRDWLLRATVLGCTFIVNVLYLTLYRSRRGQPAAAQAS